MCKTNRASQALRNEGGTESNGGFVLILVFAVNVYGHQGASVHRLLMAHRSLHGYGVAVLDRAQELEVYRAGMVENLRAKELPQRLGGEGH